ncbi:hypothetical protein [Demetria terragena]|uniref:hypothetical protein n=1 Tax=Demetria terragena TaxID=63959 RepID=UPI000368B61D|nr:hypothetical protein [Demetria terragena]
MKSPVRCPWWAALVVVALVGASLVAIFWEPGPEPSPGTIVDGKVSAASSRSVGYEQTEVNRWYAQMPYGRLNLTSTVGRAVQVGAAEHLADGDARWVEVEWDPDVLSRGATPIWPGANLSERQEPSSRLVLVAGGRRHVVVERLLSTSVQASLVVAVANATDLHFVVEAGGRQTRAALEPVGTGSDPRTTKDCSEEDASATGGVRPLIECGLTAERAPYVPGLGWAPKGQDWVIVRETEAPSLDRRADDTVADWRGEDRGGRPVYYRRSGNSSLKFAVTGGRKPVKTAGRASSTSEGSSLGERAYLVPSSKTVEVTLTYRTDVSPRSDQEVPAAAPKSATITAKASVSVEAQS